MNPQIIKNENYIEVIGHYDDKVLCAKMTLLADLYAVEHRDGYAKFRVEDEAKLKAVDEKLEFISVCDIYGAGLNHNLYLWYSYDGIEAPTYATNIGIVPIDSLAYETSGSCHYFYISDSDSVFSPSTDYVIAAATGENCDAVIQNAYTIYKNHEMSNLMAIRMTISTSGYTITYETNGGTSVPQATEQTTLPNPLPTTTKSGYNFGGWFTDSTLQTQAFAGASISQDTTLYAKWNEITYLASGGDIASVANAIRTKGGTSSSLAFPSGMVSAIQNIPTGNPIEISTDEGMSAVLTSANVGKAYLFTGTTGTYTNGDIYVVEES